MSRQSGEHIELVRWNQNDDAANLEVVVAGAIQFIRKTEII